MTRLHHRVTYTAPRRDGWRLLLLLAWIALAALATEAGWGQETRTPDRFAAVRIEAQGLLDAAGLPQSIWNTRNLSCSADACGYTLLGTYRFLDCGQASKFGVEVARLLVVRGYRADASAVSARLDIGLNLAYVSVAITRTDTNYTDAPAFAIAVQIQKIFSDRYAIAAPGSED